MAYAIKRSDHEKETIRLISVSKRVGKSVKYIPDSQIGFLNISDATDEQLKRMRLVGKPLHGSGEVVDRHPYLIAPIGNAGKPLPKQGKPYQALIHELLEKAISRAA